jgi:hypothetical protein
MSLIRAGLRPREAVRYDKDEPSIFFKRHAFRTEREVSSFIIEAFVLLASPAFDVELRLSPRWVGGNIKITDAMKTCHILNAYIFETNNRKVINNTSLDSL